MWGCTNVSGTARIAAHGKRKRDKAQNGAWSDVMRRDRLTRKESKWDDQFVLMAESFGMTPDEFMRKLTTERQLQKLTNRKG